MFVCRFGNVLVGRNGFFPLKFFTYMQKRGGHHGIIGFREKTIKNAKKVLFLHRENFCCLLFQKFSSICEGGEVIRIFLIFGNYGSIRTFGIQNLRNSVKNWLIQKGSPMTKIKLSVDLALHVCNRKLLTCVH